LTGVDWPLLDEWVQNPFNMPSGSSGPLFPYINLYLAQLKEQGYAPGSLYEQVYILKACDLWLKRTGLDARDLDESVAQECLRRVIEGGYGKNAAASTLRRLLAMLRRIGVTPEAKATPPSPCEQLACAYGRFLLEEHNLSPQTVSQRRLTASRFLSERFGSGPPNPPKLRAPDVIAFVQRHARDHGSSHARQLTTGMRLFLRYLHYRSLTDTDLSLAVPTVARWSLSSLPKHLSAAQVRQVLSHCDRDSARGRRNHAILLLLAYLGLRAGEVIVLNLEDIDWDYGRITVCGKGKQSQLPLPAEVAKAIAHYLRHDRPKCPCRRVFIRDYAPLGGFQRSSSIAKIVQRALVNAGVVSARKGAHLLRHSLATEMLRKGASLDEIGEVLRHRSTDTTAIYAKVDINALRELALPWPGGVQ
jgi:site-specific recombinase XerD